MITKCVFRAGEVEVVFDTVNDSAASAPITSSIAATTTIDLQPFKR